MVITKLDGTAKGGALFSIARELELPILYVGVGEKMQDLCEFSVKDYLDAILEPIFK